MPGLARRFHDPSAAILAMLTQSSATSGEAAGQVVRGRQVNDHDDVLSQVRQRIDNEPPACDPGEVKAQASPLSGEAIAASLRTRR